MLRRKSLLQLSVV